MEQYVAVSFLLFFCLFRATPKAYGSYQARVGIGAAAVSLCYICDLRCSSHQHQILNPLSKARDQTHIVLDTSQILNPPSHSGNSFFFFWLPYKPGHHNARSLTCCAQDQTYIPGLQRCHRSHCTTVGTPCCSSYTAKHISILRPSNYTPSCLFNRNENTWSHKHLKNVHSSFLHNCQKLAMAQISITHTHTHTHK